MERNFVNTTLLSKLMLIGLVMICQQSVLAQLSDFKTVQALFQKHRTNALQEKMYVHTDKEFYLAGETIWFKIYNVDATFHQPLDVSKVAYLEILDAEHKPVVQAKVALKEGIGVGSLKLPQEISTGSYFFRAYTNWMKNFDTDFFYQKNISIANTIKEVPVKEIKQDSELIDIQFFPEGGNLVNGIKSKIAFRAVDQTGKGINFKGVITNSNNDTLLQFAPSQFGIGSFELTPLAQVGYKAIITVGDRTITKELPAAYAQGFALSLSENKEEVNINVQTSEALDGATIYLFAHTRNIVFENLTATIKNKSARFTVDKKKLGDGISHFTLFNTQMQPVCERLYFKQPEHQLVINATPDKSLYNSREKINLNIDVSDKNGKAKHADLSIAVYHVDSLSSYGEDILSYLLLSSDLKGTIESPAYYFSHTDSANHAIDDLMLTHGWRRFKWEQLLQNKPAMHQFLPEIEGQIITAKVIDAQTEQPAKEAKAYLSVPGKTFQFYTGVSNDSGKVNFYTKGVYGLNEIVAQVDQDKNYRIDVETPFFEKSSGRAAPVFHYKQLRFDKLLERSINMQVQHVYADTAIPVNHSLADSTVFYGKAQMNYLLDNYVRFPTMEEVLREYVREINVYKQNKSFSIGLMKKQPTGIVDRKNPLVLLDGVPIFDINKLMAYDPLKVRELQTIDMDYYKGNLAFEGVVSFRTYTGRPEGLQTDPKATIIDYDGLQLQREFYAPVYDTEKSRSSRLPDFRHLLYWQPQLKMNAQKQTVNFYSSDLSEQFLVVVQGLSSDGYAGSKTFMIHVDSASIANKKN